MGKRIRQLVMIIIIMIMALIPIKASAYNFFKLTFKEGYNVKTGDIFKLPIVISEVNIDSNEQGIVDFVCTLTFEDSVFDMMSSDEDFIKLNDELAPYADITFNPTSKRLVFKINPSASEEAIKALKNNTEIATIKLRAKTTVTSGDYTVGIENVIGEDGKRQIVGNGGTTTITVQNISTRATENHATTQEGETEVINNMSKEAKLTINANKEGTQVTITPDEVNGAVIEKVLVDGTEITRANGGYTFSTVNGKTYSIVAFGKDGQMLYSEKYTVNKDKTDTDTNPVIDPSKDQNKGTNTNQGITPTNNAGIGNNNGKQYSTVTSDTKAEIVNNGNALKTGDYIVIAMGILLVAVITLVVVRSIKKIKE